MNKRLHKLFLRNLFHRLESELGYALSMNKYFLLLNMIQNGHGLMDMEELKSVCELLYLRKPQHQKTFQLIFTEVVDTDIHYIQHLITPTGTTELQDKPKEREQENDKENNPNIEEDTNTPPPNHQDIDDNAMEEDLENEAAELVLSFGENTANQDSLKYGNNGENKRKHHFILTDDYLPITDRAMTLSWRYLKTILPQGTTDEIDIEATIELTANQGIFTEAVYLPQSTNIQQLIVLIDHKGSMVAFHKFAEQLIKTAKIGIGEKNVQAYYFHNLPQKYVYRNTGHTQYVALQKLLNQNAKANSSLLIFSDAGAAKGNFNEKRIEATKTLLQKNHTYIPNMVWLNPLPQKRWRHTSAAYIAQHIPMFPLLESEKMGLDHAIKTLRGIN